MKTLKLIIASALISCQAINAQTDLCSKYMDSLSVIKEQIDNTRIYTTQNGVSVDTDKDGRYFELFTPLTFYHSPAERLLAFESSDNDYADTEVQDAVDQALMNVYMHRPGLVTDSQKKLDEVGGLKEVETTANQVDVVEAPVATATAPVADVETFDVVIKKPNFWTFKQDYYLQFLQNFFTSNWYKGGERSYSMLGSITLEANYNNKQKVTFDNKLELKLGFQTSEGDSLHKFRTTDDLIRYTGKLGIQATKRWYYTVQLITYTQFHQGVKSNDRFIYSDFMSPFNANLSVGMDYKFESKNKKASGTLNLAPAAYNFRYVGREALATRYSLKEGKHTLHDIGSSLTFNFKWTPSDLITYETRLWGYTTYKRAEVEWENTFTFKLSKYISAKLFLYPRFDDGTARDDDYGYFQFREYTSLGFSYKL
ncbi:MAG: DUF3078 domain-containing protein [Prevotellaceae bacterium]|nr:DUF3078 domain-containing protein [Prevotellaceae bacterium]